MGGVEDALLYALGDTVADDLEESRRDAGGANIVDDFVGGGRCRIGEVGRYVDYGDLECGLLMGRGRHG